MLWGLKGSVECVFMVIEWWCCEKHQEFGRGFSDMRFFVSFFFLTYMELMESV